jgi:hypothetical protein
MVTPPFPSDTKGRTMERYMFEQLVLQTPWFVYNGFWRFVASLAILLLGLIVARQITSWVRRMSTQLIRQRQLNDSPLGVVLEPAVALRGSGLLSTSLFTFVMFLFIAWAGEILGITFFAGLLSLIIGFLPQVLSAIIVMVLGVLLAGVAERVVKQQARKIIPGQAILTGTIASSFTLVMFILIALSELGIASEFIMILFAGFIFAFALAAGIALGLGAKTIVHDALQTMIHEETAHPETNPTSKTTRK